MTTACRYLALAALLCLSNWPLHALAGDWIYHAREGDTLWKLCVTYTNKRGCPVELGRYNGIADATVVPVGSEIRIPGRWLVTPPEVGRVTSVQGEVSYDARNSGDTIPLSVGQPLLLGSRITCGDGTATIVLGNYSRMLLRPGCDLEISTMSTGAAPGQAAELELGKGDAEVEVKPRSRFEIRTPSAVAAVRGTEYRLSVDGDSTRSEVLAGSVAVAADKTVLLPPGFGLLARQDEALGEPRPLLPPPGLAPEYRKRRVDSTLPFVFEWENHPEAVAWQVDVHTPGALVGRYVTSYRVTRPTIELVGLEPRCYRLSVRAIDAEGFNGMESRVPLCIVEPPTGSTPPAAAPEEEESDLAVWPLAIAGALALILAL